ncbi:hypothetical protein J7M02_00430 [Candidatus Aerophobetes bacterium]|nr:hypothetical protein [Candidatus Aerophobetes bacterium]
MKKSNKNPKNQYRIKLLREFDLLKSEESMREVLEYTRFIKEQERELEKLNSSPKK